MRLTRFLYLLELLVVFTLAASSHALTCDEALQRATLHTYTLDSLTYKVEVVSSQLKTSDVQPGELTLRAISQKEPLGLFTVYATITRNGQSLEAGQVTLRIRKFADVLVSTDNLKRHDQPSENALALQRMEITSLQEQPVTSFADLQGQRMKRNLTKGQILTSSALEPVPDIEVGREVSITCTNGLFTITAAGVAEQTGSAGDYVRVRNRTSGKTVLARVVDEHTVTIEP